MKDKKFKVTVKFLEKLKEYWEYSDHYDAALIIEEIENTISQLKGQNYYA